MRFSAPFLVDYLVYDISASRKKPYLGDEVASVMKSDTAPIQPAGKLATTWANLKAR